MRHHFVWLLWSTAFLIPWLVLYLSSPRLRGVMVRISGVTALFGLTEPLFVPSYWNPPSLFELAQRTRFDVESLIFSFAIGGIGAVLYTTLMRTHYLALSSRVRKEPWHRFHRIALWVPVAAFLVLERLPWNAIYSALIALVLGAVASVSCRPTLLIKTIVSGGLFFVMYALFMLALVWTAPGYIAAVWNLPALSGILLGTIPIEELVFGFAFGMYWCSVYEHLFWAVSVTHDVADLAAEP